MEGARPKLKIPLTTLDKVIEALCWSGLAATWLAAFIAFSQLPEIIPTHFNGSGQADGYGSKSTIWLLPVIPTILVAGLSFLNRFPHTFNYLEEITPANAEKNYRWGTRLLRYSKLFVVLLFGAILGQVIFAARQPLAAAENTWPVTAIIVTALVWPVAVLLIAYIQTRKNN